MDIETFRNYCLAKKGVTEGFPFDQDTLVFKVMGKMFALTDVDTFISINLKCKPEKARELREQYAAVQPGYHMNKTHWNTITIDGSVTDNLMFEWIDHSYNLVVTGLTKKLQQELSEM
jgi:predicted DNA-binding protein (MmcQ/YjbR family)